ncbi:MAG TPA: neutral/alkaline non-lysosomal ceramidase N-terminal domain-containing protein [Ohtaekwangia sp.]
MILRKILKVLLWSVGSLIAIIVLFLAISLVPIDRTSVLQSEAQQRMKDRLDSLKVSIHHSSQGYSVGFGKENITPAKPVALAGYGSRRGKSYTSVRDSIYVRTIVIQNGDQRYAIVSADLLIIPPTVVEILEKKLPDIGFSINNTYLGAVHTHNSIGNWGEGVTGFMFGFYQDTVVQFIADKIIRCIDKASHQLLPATLQTAAIPIDAPVRNRLTNNNPVDSLFRVIEVQRSDSSKLLFMSYTAHATCLFSRDLSLSRDYPGKLVDQMEASGYTFAMFMAGAVGSHGCNPPEFGEPCIDWMTEQIQTKFNEEKFRLHPVHDSVLTMIRVPLELPKAQAKVLENVAMRPWLFKSAFGEYPVYLTALRIGDVVLLGTPCDFSGELSPPIDSLAESLHVHSMITSFNGGYIGYVTPGKYYDFKHYETQLMNWYGVGSGEYISESMEYLLRTISDKQSR